MTQKADDFGPFKTLYSVVPDTASGTMTSKLVAGVPPVSAVVANSSAGGDATPVNTTSSTVASVLVDTCYDYY